MKTLSRELERKLPNTVVNGANTPQRRVTTRNIAQYRLTIEVNNPDQRSVFTF